MKVLLNLLSAVALLVCVNGLIIAGAVGYEVNMPMAATILIGLLYIIIGNVMPKLRFNYVAGIRTPWTLSDERVWDKTHRLGGKGEKVSPVVVGDRLLSEETEVELVHERSRFERMICALIPKQACRNAA